MIKLFSLNFFVTIFCQLLLQNFCGIFLEKFFLTHWQPRDVFRAAFPNTRDVFGRGVGVAVESKTWKKYILVGSFQSSPGRLWRVYILNLLQFTVKNSFSKLSHDRSSSLLLICPLWFVLFVITYISIETQTKRFRPHW